MSAAYEPPKQRHANKTTDPQTVSKPKRPATSPFRLPIKPQSSRQKLDGSPTTKLNLKPPSRRALRTQCSSRNVTCIEVGAELTTCRKNSMANRKSSVAKLVSTWGKSKENSIRNPKQREIRQRIVNKQTIKLDNRKAPLKLEI
jgi:hypothetical protein